MAKKSIILSNDDGRVTFSNTSSAWLEDTDKSLNITSVTASNIAIESIGSGIKLLQVSGNLISVIQNSSLDGSALQWNGSKWVTSSVVVREYSGSASGDLSGSYPNPKVVNIGNVTSGVLSVANGGTGLSIASGTDFILESSGSTITALTGATSNQGSVLSYKNGVLSFNDIARTPYIVYYTVPAGTTAGNGAQAQFVWTKPEGHKMARIICQGAGSGGSSGHSFSVAEHPGVGGGSGGYSEDILMLDLIESQVTVSVGVGGLGGPGNPVTGQNIWLGTGDSNASVGCSRGGAGGNSSFGSYVVGYGGGQTGFAWESGGAGGSGNIFNGSSGGTRSGATGGSASGASVTNNSSGGGTGNNGSFGTVTVSGISNQTRNFNYSVDSNGKTIDAAFGVGARGATWAGASTAKPSKPTFGGGGGGGSSSTNTGQSGGGDGGDGFVIVISW